MSPWLSCSPFYPPVIHSPHSSQRGLSKTEESFTMLSQSYHSPPKPLSWCLSTLGTKGWAPYHVIKTPTWPAVPYILNLPLLSIFLSFAMLQPLQTFSSLSTHLRASVLLLSAWNYSDYVNSLTLCSLFIPFTSSPHSSPWLCPSFPSGICANITSSKKPPLSPQSKEIYAQPPIILHLIIHFYVIHSTYH